MGSSGLLRRYAYRGHWLPWSTCTNVDDPLTSARYARRYGRDAVATLTARLRGRRIAGLRFEPDAGHAVIELAAGDELRIAADGVHVLIAEVRAGVAGDRRGRQSASGVILGADSAPRGPE